MIKCAPHCQRPRNLQVFRTPALYPSSRPGLPIKAYLTGSLASL